MLLLVLIGLAISLWASSNVKSTFNRYSRLNCAGGITAENAAERILRESGVSDVRIERIAGSLTDHYDPTQKVLRLSSSVYGSSSAAAVGVAAHECGHAVQDSVGYQPLRIRRLLVPIANFGSQASVPIILVGYFLGMSGLARLGAYIFFAVVLFQLVTLPVEFDASNRACRILAASGRFTDEELRAVRKVLTAAALTYVASALNALIQFLRLLAMTNSRRR